MMLSISVLAAPPGPPTVRSFAWTAVAMECPSGDGVCLSYDGAIPGPVLDVNLGDSVVIVLENRIAESFAALPLTDAERAADAWLADTALSFHVHGTVLTSDVDGIPGVEGTGLIRSVAEPTSSFTYRFRAQFPGTWHFHDHVIGADGSEGARRGLFGTLIVRGGAEPRADNVLSLHLQDDDANAGGGLDAIVRAGESFEVPVIGLGNLVWTAVLKDPAGGIVGAVEVGPGMSDRIRVDAATAGTYSWQALGSPVPYRYTGAVEVVAG